MPLPPDWFQQSRPLNLSYGVLARRRWVAQLCPLGQWPITNNVAYGSRSTDFLLGADRAKVHPTDSLSPKRRKCSPWSDNSDKTFVTFRTQQAITSSIDCGFFIWPSPKAGRRSFTTTSKDPMSMFHPSWTSGKDSTRLIPGRYRRRPASRVGRHFAGDAAAWRSGTALLYFILLYLQHCLLYLESVNYRFWHQNCHLIHY
jgi:hypothetical protein